MVNNHFAGDSLLFVRVNQESVARARDYLSAFFLAFEAMVSDHKTDYWLVDLDELLDLCPPTLIIVHQGVIVRYLGIPFGVGLSLVAMWDWCLECLQRKLLS